MKIWRYLTLAGLVLLMVAAVVTPAMADDEVTLTVRNLTQENVELRLSGPDKVTITLKQVITKIELEPGNYTYRYKACGGRLYTGTIHVGFGSQFKLIKCEKGLYATLVISNLTGRSFELLLHGPKTYRITIIPGEYKYTVQAGRYEYKTIVCGESKKGEKGFKSKTNADWVWSCKKSSD
jgi:hypothetical protein